ncbi:uncharacterized protein K460DRAFT_361331 [Cucurbitaria berberidis CBS 394.84]|uniref:Uncharacterized protein n=1 Tax=Cucurbitaria berberidis CBS 394.84 TaxID=1168544 RepID=A0A9P4GQ41_9PLEO|nr:uncharacterized protein K460DRAFT_361331 [Cucurbitaria berberidis CBS 394.84]KAF1850558.1 hypothetical protein K460DRAFT_361331 [Cucurbitaria berberidis CBS 394.84]
MATVTLDQPAALNEPATSNATATLTSTQGGGATSEVRDAVLLKFLADYNKKPLSALRLDLNKLAYGDSDITKQPQQMHEILTKHGYGDLTAEEIQKLLQPPRPNAKSEPITTPVQTSPVPTEKATFSLTLFSGSYNVTTPNPPTFVLYVEDDSGGIRFDDKSKYSPTLEIDGVGDYWATWTANEPSNTPKMEYKVKFTSQWDDKEERIDKSFQGYFKKPGKEGTTPFNGTLQKPAEVPKTAKWWEDTGKWVMLGVPLGWTISSYLWTVKRDSVKTKAATRQSQTAAAENKSKAECALAERHIQSTNPARKEALLRSIRKGMAETVTEYVKKKYPGEDAEQRVGNFEPKFEGADKDLAKKLSDRRKTEIQIWMEANGPVPESQILEEMVKQGQYSKKDFEARTFRIREQASQLIANNLSSFGSDYQMGEMLVVDAVRSYNYTSAKTSVVNTNGKIAAADKQLEDVAALDRKYNEYANSHPLQKPDNESIEDFEKRKGKEEKEFKELTEAKTAREEIKKVAEREKKDLEEKRTERAKYEEKAKHDIFDGVDKVDKPRERKDVIEKFKKNLGFP